MDQPFPTVDEWLLLHGNDPDPIEGHHLISVDELRAAGALEVPSAWRKSLGPDSSAERNLFSDLDDEEDSDDSDSES
jgi:hypothetical protein